MGVFLSSSWTWLFEFSGVGAVLSCGAEIMELSGVCRARSAFIALDSIVRFSEGLLTGGA